MTHLRRRRQRRRVKTQHSLASSIGQNPLFGSVPGCICYPRNLVLFIGACDDEGQQISIRYEPMVEAARVYECNQCGAVERVVDDDFKLELRELWRKGSLGQNLCETCSFHRALNNHLANRHPW